VNISANISLKTLAGRMNTAVPKHHKVPRTDDIEALSIFEFELPSLRVSVELAEILGESVMPKTIKHPVLKFAIDRRPPPWSRTCCSGWRRCWSSWIAPAPP
jgi:hypothetical protein